MELKSSAASPRCPLPDAPKPRSLAYTQSGLPCPREQALGHWENFFPIPNLLGKLSEIFPILLLFLEKSYYTLSSRRIRNISYLSSFLTKHLAYCLAHLLNEGKSEWMNEWVNENILKERAYIIEWELRLQILTLIHKAIFSFPWVAQAGSAQWFVWCMHYTKVPDWGPVGLNTDLSSEPWSQATSTWNKGTLL